MQRVQLHQVRDVAQAQLVHEVEQVGAGRTAVRRVVVVDEDRVDPVLGQDAGAPPVVGQPVLTDHGHHLVGVAEPVPIDRAHDDIDLAAQGPGQVAHVSGQPGPTRRKRAHHSQAGATDSHRRLLSGDRR